MTIGLRADVSGQFGSITINGTEAIRVNPNGIPAMSIAFTPSGNIAAANVQAAIQELDTETQSGLATKVSKSGDTMTGTLTTNGLVTNQGRLLVNANVADAVIVRKQVAGVGNNYISFQNSLQSVTGYVGHGSAGSDDMHISSYNGNMTLWAKGASLEFNGNQINFSAPSPQVLEIVNRTNGLTRLYSAAGTKVATLDGAGLWATPGAVSYTSNAANMYMFPGGEMTMGSASARRFKTDIRPLEYGLAHLNQVDPVRFRSLCPGDEPDKEFIGVIADDVLPIMPELVTFDPEGEVAGFDYVKLTVVLINAVKELSAKVADLEARLK